MTRSTNTVSLVVRRMAAWRMVGSFCLAATAAPDGIAAEIVCLPSARQTPSTESKSGAFHADDVLLRLAARICRLIELGDDLLTAIALPRVHDQVVPNSTFVEHWTAGKATFFFPEDEIQVGPTWKISISVEADQVCGHHACAS